MVWSARISKTKKIGLFVMFSGGLITAIFGGLRCGYVLQDGVQGPQLAGEWSCRESFVAVFISNFPVLFPILHRAVHRAKVGSSGGDPSGSGGTPGNSRGFKLSTLSREKKRNKFKHPLSLPAETYYDQFGSEEEIIATGEGGVGGEKTDGKSTVVPSIPEEDIKVTKEWRVQSQVDQEAVEREKKKAVTGYAR
jgi:hypothetical protein